MSENLVYEASVYEYTVKYRNFNGVEKTSKLYFSLHPLALMQVFAGYVPKKIKSGNPALNGKAAEMSDEDQIKLVHRLASQSVGTPSDDGESWVPFEDFEESIAGKAFLTKLVSSDQIRKDWSDKVILSPFRAFVQFAKQDPTNSQNEVAELEKMLAQMERVFTMPNPKDESAEDRRARLLAELGKLDEGSQN